MNDNETVEEVYGAMIIEANGCDSSNEVIEGYELREFADRILAAHKREKCEWAASITKQRSINKELVDDNESLKAGITSLHALVKELVDEMENIMSIFCHGNCEGCPSKDDCDAFRCRALVAKAREVCK